MSMKETILKVKGKVMEKALMAGTAMSLAIHLAPVTAFAASQNGGAQAGDKAKKATDTIITNVVGAFAFVGAFFGFLGLWKVIQAFRNDNNPEAMSSGAKDIVVGAILLAMPVLWNAIKNVFGL